MHDEEYPKMFALEGNNWWYRARKDLVQALIQQHHSTAHSILDIGCGTGYVLSQYTHFQKRLGVENHPLAIQFAARRSVKTVPIVAEAKGDFDVILLMDVIEHIQQPIPFMRQVAEKMAPNGIAIVSVPAFQWLWSAHDAHVKHVKRYSMPALKKELDAAGFNVEWASYWNASFFIPAALKKKLGNANESDLQEVNPLLNSAMHAILQLENKWIRHIPTPIGTSIFAVVRKK